MFNLKGKVAVITGASSGLGKQMAKGFASQGADLVILARRYEKLIELKEELNNRVEKYGLKAKETMEMSQIIDLLINVKMQQKKP